MDNENFQTQDTVLAAYLTAKGFPVVNTSYRGKFATFIFSDEAKPLAEAWLFTPTDEMKLVKAANFERRRLLKKVRDEAWDGGGPSEY